MIADWLIALGGVWLIISPFVLGVTGAGKINSIVLGAVLAMIALVDIALESRSEIPSSDSETSDAK